MSAEPSVAHRASIRSAVTRSVLCAGYGARTLQKPTYLFPSVAGRSARWVFITSLLGSARPQNCRSPSTHTCFDMRAGSSWPMMATIPALQHYLGHKNIQHTVRYTELTPDRFRDFWL